MEAKYTKHHSNLAELMIHAVRADLTPALGMPQIHS